MNAPHEGPPQMRTRMDNPFGGEGHKGLSEDERAMQRLILDEYKKDGRVYLKEVQRIRESDSKMPLGEVVKKLYEEIEEEQRRIE